jgi:hypothetical protein
MVYRTSGLTMTTTRYNGAKKNVNKSEVMIASDNAYITGRRRLIAGDGQLTATALEGKQVDSAKIFGEIETGVVYGMEWP